MDARADGTLRTDVYMANLKEGSRLEMELKAVASASLVGQRVFELTTASRQTLTAQWDNIRKWDPEHPHLYQLTLRLLDADGNLLHEMADRIGFRTVEFRPADGIYLNGVKLLVKGTNRHCFDPETGRSVSRELDLKDARLIKQMNSRTFALSARQTFPAALRLVGLALCVRIGWLAEQL